MKHAKNKTIAFGVVLVMCMTAFGVCLTMSDGSDATDYPTITLNYTAGDTDNSVHQVKTATGMSSSGSGSCVILSGNVPTGMTFADESKGARNSMGYWYYAQFKLNGSPTTNGTYVFTVRGTVNGQSTDSTVTVTVTGGIEPSATSSPLTATYDCQGLNDGNALPTQMSYSVGDTIDLTVDCECGDGITYSWSPSAPAGISIVNANVAYPFFIRGTWQTVGTYALHTDCNEGGCENNVTFTVTASANDGHGTADNPLTDLTINSSSSGTYYLASGSHLKITGDIVLYDGDEGAVVTVPNTLSNQLPADGNDSIMWYEGNVTAVGTHTIRYDFCQAIYIEDVDEVILETIDTWNVTLIVVSAEYTHTVAYAANGGSGSMSNTVVTDSVNGNSSVTLAANGFTKTGYTFVGWKIGNTIYQPGQTVSVGANATVTATAQWSLNTLAIGGVAQQYVVKGAYGSFTATCSSDPSGASVTYSASNVPSGLSVNISGSTITYRYTGSLDSNNQKDLSFTLVASASGYSVNSTTVVNIHVVAQLAFTNSPSAGVIGS